LTLPKSAYWAIVSLLSLNAAVCIVGAARRAVEPMFGQDLQGVYKCSRLWLHGQNPYGQYSDEQWRQITGEPSLLKLPVDGGPATPYPPIALMVAGVVSWLPWEQAKVAWLGLNLLFSAVLAFSLWKLYASVVSPQWIVVVILLIYGSTGLRVGLANGQHALIAVTALAAMLVCLSRGKDSLAGLMLALALYKFQLFPAFVLLLLVKRKFKALTWAAALFSIAMAVFFAWIDGPASDTVRDIIGTYQYWSARDWDTGLGSNSAFDLRRLLLTVLPVSAVGYVNGLLSLFAFGCLAAWANRRSGLSRLEIAACAALPLWISYSPVYHSILLGFVMPVLIEHTACEARPWHRNLLILFNLAIAAGWIGLANHPEKLLAPAAAQQFHYIFDMACRLVVFAAFVAVMTLLQSQRSAAEPDPHPAA
jgi:Glycosyltransferase family 87